MSDEDAGDNLEDHVKRNGNKGDGVVSAVVSPAKEGVGDDGNGSNRSRMQPLPMESKKVLYLDPERLGRLLSTRKKTPVEEESEGSVNTDVSVSKVGGCNFPMTQPSEQVNDEVIDDEKKSGDDIKVCDKIMSTGKKPARVAFMSDLMEQALKKDEESAVIVDEEVMDYTSTCELYCSLVQKNGVKVDLLDDLLKMHKHMVQNCIIRGVNDENLRNCVFDLAKHAKEGNKRMFSRVFHELASQLFIRFCCNVDMMGNFVRKRQSVVAANPYQRKKERKTVGPFHAFAAEFDTPESIKGKFLFHAVAGVYMKS